jgi:hypothetical protein
MEDDLQAPIAASAPRAVEQVKPLPTLVPASRHTDCAFLVSSAIQRMPDDTEAIMRKMQVTMVMLGLVGMTAAGAVYADQTATSPNRQNPAQGNPSATHGIAGDAEKGPLTGKDAGNIPTQAEEGERSSLRTGVIGDKQPASDPIAKDAAAQSHAGQPADAAGQANSGGQPSPSQEVRKGRRAE